jgi:hypothetical protein
MKKSIRFILHNDSSQSWIPFVIDHILPKIVMSEGNTGRRNYKYAALRRRDNDAVLMYYAYYFTPKSNELVFWIKPELEYEKNFQLEGD